MPSLSSILKRSRRESSQLDEEQRNDVQGNLKIEDSEEQEQQRQSKRDYFRSLLKKSGIRSEPKRRSVQSVTSSNLEVPSRKLTAPMSGPNKPLPLPPAAGTEPEPAPKIVKKLERIISPIAPADLHSLFSGAPQFFARSEGHHTGAPHPSVAFPWNAELEMRDLCDHVQIHDEAWSTITAWPHITRDVQRSSEAVREQHQNQKAHFLPRCRERPSMLSMQGIERGTVGFQAALEMGVADALRVPEQKNGGGGDTLSERRRKFLNSKEGLRALTESTLIERLTSISTTYQEDPVKYQRPTVELYTELFTQILFPPSRVTDADDPYSLQVQIEVLINVLAAPEVWLDFSLVEWRIRLGQILWGPPIESDSEDDIVINEEVAQDPGVQKYWLLLQILLSCELLMRLDTISANIDHGIEELKDAELNRFDKEATVVVKWSLILARQWLENIRIESIKSDALSEKKAPTGWLSTLTGTAPVRKVEVDGTIHNVQFLGKNQTRQLSGLLHFARKLNWPSTDVLAAKFSSGGINISNSSQRTPATRTPSSVSTQRSSSYFARRPSIRRKLSRQQRMSAIIHPSGWLSCSYMNGLVLPGEGLGHFLISTLLENDEKAVSRLGEEANLYGGFSYGNKSFWSTSCIVGRVLAAGKGASECMGWISSDVTPWGCGESWVNIDFEMPPQSESDGDAKPRIWHKTAIERDGSVIGGADSSSVLPGDFILPSDEHYQSPLLIKLESLDLFTAADSVHTTPMNEMPTPLNDISEAPIIRTYSAMMRFSLAGDGEETTEINIALTHDINFVTAFPCVPSNEMELLNTPTSPSLQIPQQIPQPIRTGSPGTFTGHPLHKAFTYTKISLSTLLKTPSTVPFAALLSPPPSPLNNPTNSSTHTTNSHIPKVLVIDCADSTTSALPTRAPPSPHVSKNKGKHFGSDVEILARALCAERGWDALIIRRGRGCLSCAIREASALGWRVVLRFA